MMDYNDYSEDIGFSEGDGSSGEWEDTGDVIVVDVPESENSGSAGAEGGDTDAVSEEAW